MKFPENDKISKDVYNHFTNKNTSKTISFEYYENFIIFLKNCFEFEYFNDKNVNIVDFIDTFSNIQFFFKVINKYNVFVTEQPSFLTYYLSDNNQLLSSTKFVSDIDINGFLNRINEENKIFILYMVRNNGRGTVRYIELDNDHRYLQFNIKDRKRKERKLKLDIIYEQIYNKTHNIE